MHFNHLMLKAVKLTFLPSEYFVPHLNEGGGPKIVLCSLESWRNH